MYAHIKLVHSESGNYKADSILGKKITKLKLASPLVFSFPQSLSPQLQLCLFPISSLLVKRDGVVNSVGKKGQQPAGKMFFLKSSRAWSSPVGHSLQSILERAPVDQSPEPILMEVQKANHQSRSWREHQRAKHQSQCWREHQMANHQSQC